MKILVRPLSRPFSAFGQCRLPTPFRPFGRRSLPAQLRRPRLGSATAAVRRLLPLTWSGRTPALTGLRASSRRWGKARFRARPGDLGARENGARRRGRTGGAEGAGRLPAGADPGGGKKLSRLCDAARGCVDNRALDGRIDPRDPDPEEQAPQHRSPLRPGDRRALCAKAGGVGGSRGGRTGLYFRRRLSNRLWSRTVKGGRLFGASTLSGARVLGVLGWRQLYT